MSAKLPSLSSPFPSRKLSVAASHRNNKFPSPAPPWPIPVPKLTVSSPNLPLLPNQQLTDTPLSLHLIKIRKQSETLASNARAVPSPDRGAVGNAVWSLACLLEDIKMATLPPTDTRHDNMIRVLREERCSVVWLFKNVFSASPNLAVGVLDLTAEFVAKQTAEMLEKEKNVTVLEEFKGRRDAIGELFESEEANSLVFSNYAQLLYQEKKDYDRAKKYFELSVKAGSETDAEVLSRYGIFLWRHEKNTEAAEELLLQAIAADPENCYHHGIYAAFLWATGNTETCYPLYIKEKEEVHDDDTITLPKEMQAQCWSDIGITDPDKRKTSEKNCPSDYIRQKTRYERIIINGYTNSMILSNYAQLLYQYEKDLDRAENYFKLAIAADPEYVEAIARYATFLWEARGELEAAEDMFLRVTELEPDNPYYQCGYVYFLLKTGGKETCYPIEDCGVEEDDADNDDKFVTHL